MRILAECSVNVDKGTNLKRNTTLRAGTSLMLFQQRGSVLNAKVGLFKPTS